VLFGRRIIRGRTWQAVSNISFGLYMIPMVLNSGNTIKSIPGRPILVPTTISQIFLALAI
jgi:hypothetical protein